jgi:O-antigen biosynthesis protein
MIISLKTKFSKLQQLSHRLGTYRVFRYVYQSIIYRLTIQINYKIWLVQNFLIKRDITTAKKEIDRWKLLPKFSVIMPVYNVDVRWLKKAIESVQNQIYPNWELCIADDASPQECIRSVLTEYSKCDPRIKLVFRTENGQISAASNSALNIATGDYIALLDHDDELTINALFENAKLINQYPQADFIYSDEDKISIKGTRFSPCFKPNWSPEYLYSCMYTCHLSVYRTSIIREIGGFRSEYDGSQDYDLVLRVIEKTKNIYHIPQILYHWRSISSSTASGSQAKPWAYTAGRKALEAVLERSSYLGYVEETLNPGIYRVRPNIIGSPLVSIIIPSTEQSVDISNSLCYLENCINSLKKISSYYNYEIIVVGGDGISQSLLDTNQLAPNLHLISYTEPVNCSKQINIGASIANGQFFVLLSDKTKVITPDWLESMLELSQLAEIGAVGAKILFPDVTLRQSGIVFFEGNAHCPFYRFENEYPGYHCSNIVNKNYLAVSTSCLMMKKKVFQELGGLDESFPLGYSNIDLCLKAYQSGYHNAVTSYAQLIDYKPIVGQKNVRLRVKKQFNEKWQEHFKGLENDPYYHPNLFLKSVEFDLI